MAHSSSQQGKRLKREAPILRALLAVGRPFVALAAFVRVRTALHARRPRKRLIVAASALTGVVALFTGAAGTTLGLLDSQAAPTAATVSSGTVTLTNSSIANCPVSNMFPGQTNSANPCTFSATYSGSVSAYLAVDVLIESQAGNGGSKLYDGTATGLQVQITSTNPNVTYADPTVATSCPAGAPAGSTCYELDDELLSIGAFYATSTVNFSVQVSLPAGSTSAYQNGAAQIILTTHAVQAGNNAVSCTTTPVAGSPCSPSGTFKWS
jgi:hypothetical protein